MNPAPKEPAPRPASTTTLIRNATILTMNDALDIVEGSVAVADGRIVAVGAEPAGAWSRTIDAGGAYLLPGFIQTHIHLCQTLFRGYADDMPLLDWLERRVWPLEAAHTPSTLRAAATTCAIRCSSSLQRTHAAMCRQACTSLSEPSFPSASSTRCAGSTWATVASCSS